MAIVEVDGFQFLDNESIVIEQDRIEECLESFVFMRTKVSDGNLEPYDKLEYKAY